MRLNVRTEDCWLELAALRMTSITCCVTAPILMSLGGWIYTDHTILYFLMIIGIYIIGVIAGGLYILTRHQINKEEYYRLTAHRVLGACKACRPNTGFTAPPARVYNQDEDNNEGGVKQ